MTRVFSTPVAFIFVLWILAQLGFVTILHSYYNQQRNGIQCQSTTPDLGKCRLSMAAYCDVTKRRNLYVLFVPLYIYAAVCLLSIEYNRNTRKHNVYPK